MNERMKLLITIGLLLVLIAVMMSSQSADDVKEGDIATDVATTTIATSTDVILDDEVIEEEPAEVVDVEEPVVEVKGTGDLLIEDITGEARDEKDRTSDYVNPGLGISYEYPSDWVNSENSVPGQYTLRAAQVINDTQVARIDLRFYNAEVDTKSAVLTQIAGRTAFLLESEGLSTIIIPKTGDAELTGEQWSGNALSITYGVYVLGGGGMTAGKAAFDLAMSDFNVVLRSLELE